MRLVLFAPNAIKNIHIKILLSLQLMCKFGNIEFTICTQLERLQIPDYDLLYVVNCFIEPTTLPSHVKIIFGPQIDVFQPGFTGPFREDLVGKCVFNGLSEWAIKMREEFVRCSIPTVCFPFAVNIDQFKPHNTQKDLDCLVYIKHRKADFVEKALTILNQIGLSYETITYSNYMEFDYMKLLERAKFMLCLDAHESQGFALEEAMAANVPLLVCDVKSMYEEYYGDLQVNADKKPKHLLATSVPYWSEQCGIRIFDLEDLPAAIETMKTTEFHPRDYIVENLSAKVCIDRILNYFKLIEQSKL